MKQHTPSESATFETASPGCIAWDQNATLLNHATVAKRGAELGINLNSLRRLLIRKAEELLGIYSPRMSNEGEHMKPGRIGDG